jgi:cell division protein FtsN
MGRSRFGGELFSMASFERGAYEPSDDVRVFDAADDDEQEEEGSRLPLLIVIGLLVFAAFAGVVWLAYTQGVQRGRQDAPRVITAEQGPVKVAPANPGGAQNPYSGLKIYQSPAPSDETGDDEAPASPQASSSPAGTSKAATPAISPSLAAVNPPAHIEAPPAAAPPTPKPVITKSVPAKAAPPATAVTASNAPAPTKAAPSMSVPVATKPPAKLAAATAETPAPSAPAPAVAGGAFVLQIGSYKSQADAMTAWKAYQAKYPLVGGYEPNVKQVDLGEKGTWYRLRVGSFADSAAAGDFCAKLKADGAACIPSKQ